MRVHDPARSPLDTLFCAASSAEDLPERMTLVRSLERYFEWQTLAQGGGNKRFVARFDSCRCVFTYTDGRVSCSEGQVGITQTHDDGHLKASSL